MIGNDCLIIENRASFSEEKMRSLIHLYAPLLTNEGVLFYQHLLTERRQKLRVSDLLNTMRISIDLFERILGRLNEFQLVLTYRGDSEYVLLIKDVLSCREFFSHAIFGRMLAREIGVNEYKRRFEILFKEHNLSQYQNVSKTLRTGVLADWNEGSEKNYPVLKVEKREKELNSLFDIQGFLREVGPLLLPFSQRTPDNLKAISSCADLYNISPRRMRVLLDNVGRVAAGFDADVLFKLAANERVEYREIEAGEYDVPAVLFLMNQQDGKEATPSDKRILCSLSRDYGLPPAVVNVLIEHALQKHDRHLYTNYLYPVASDMHRSGVRDVKAAKEFLAKTRRAETSHSPVLKDVLPVYDNTKNPQVDLAELEAFFRKENDS